MVTAANAMWPIVRARRGEERGEVIRELRELTRIRINELLCLRLPQGIDLTPVTNHNTQKTYVKTDS